MKIKLNKYIKYSNLILILILFLTSCNSKTENLESVQITSEPVYITGKVINPIPENNTVTIYVNDILSGKQNTYVGLIDNSGNFQVKFHQYHPQDVLVRNGDYSFPLMVHPKDSIYLAFDATKISNKKELANTIQYSGDAAEINSKLINFHSEISEISIPWEQYCQFAKEFSPNEFIVLRDSLKSVKHVLMNDFIEKNNPSEELKTWLKNEIDMDYYNWLARYPGHHAELNNTDEKSVVSPSFYDYMNIPFTKEMLLNSQSDSFVSFYVYGRIHALSKNSTKNLIGYFLERKQGIYFGSNTEQNLELIEKHTNDNFLKEISIAKCLYALLDRREITEFEKHYELINKTVKAPFLREPLINKYLETKRHLENPLIDEASILESSRDTPVSELIEKIVEKHKGQIIYLDIWATWCSPCREEMPYSKKLVQELNSDKVDFVYLCTDSEEDKWKAIISEMEIEGSHYLATPAQSRFVYEFFEMSGVPYYILIDENGNIVEKGNHLRPRLSSTKSKILNLLNEQKSA